MRDLGLHGARCAARSTAPPSPTRPRCGRGIWSIGTSPRRPRTGCGSRTSPTCGPGQGSSTSRSSPTCTRGMIVGWQASRSLRTDLAPRRARASDLVTSPRRPRPRSVSSITATAGVQYLAIRYTERLAANGVVNSVGSTRRQLRQRTRREHQRALQDRTRPQQRSLARPRRPRARHPRMGRLVQPPPPLRSTTAAFRRRSSKTIFYRQTSSRREAETQTREPA